MRSPARWLRARMHRRLFAWFTLSMLAAMLLAGTATRFMLGRPGRLPDGLNAQIDGLAATWTDAPARDALAAGIARDLDVGLTLLDLEGRTLARFGAPCVRPRLHEALVREGHVLGVAEVCVESRRPRWPTRMVLGLLIAGVLLWAAAGRIAKSLTRPLGELARAAEAIGRGERAVRVAVAPSADDEIAALAHSVDDMASRIGRQVDDQRELLAAVSHELRTPLARLRVLVDLVREGRSDEPTLAGLEREVVEMDALVGELLANARLDFTAVARLPVDAVALALTALERASVDASLCAVEGEGRMVDADPTLVARALSNLLANAMQHGGGVVALRVQLRGADVSFEVDDAGPGFAAGDEERAFQPFHRAKRSASPDARSLGLGLSLVRRIAEAHGGRAYGENLAEGGARVGFTLARRA